MNQLTALARISLAAACIASFAAVGCDRSPPTTTATVASAPGVKKLPTTQISLAGHPFTLEVANNDADRMRGLMNRATMAPDEGMIFVFPDERPLKFWMKDTYLPLDIAYLDSDGVVLNIPQLWPKDLTNVPSAGPAQFAIELSLGTADRIGLKAGDRVEIPDAIRIRD